MRRDGTVLGLRDRFVHDGGAYAPYGIRLPLVTLISLMGPYRIPAMDVSFDAVFTNKTPVIPYRGRATRGRFRDRTGPATRRGAGTRTA